ncbi:LacI family DNA-binding transcriptional regulator [Cellulosimicrobium marinum]|uniref:LacI family DNA-binding transcriptional regulator n=1 Tax=Cellulosimicrobium marinum TaxID=1638992 RepID=UPI001E5623BF|nr:LacI family DNA-binding transcriptional regulator [Cellulosimicrobium marinum]MCB7136376.1 LacI family DNA-binding transcriptional regulator [Cellulosimicrobium marinum]
MSTARKRPTVKDVAAEAGVSVMTVSYAFNRPDRVAAPTRERVLDAARRLGYHRPDSTARALRSGRTGQIGVVLGEHLSYAFDDPQASAFLAGVADVCVDEGLGMVLIPTHGTGADVDRVLDAAVDAYVLWTTTDDDPVLDAVCRSGRPGAIQGGPQVPGLALVGTDDIGAARAVAGAALAHGDTPVVISFPLDKERVVRVATGGDLPPDAPFPVTRHRLEGYAAALGEAGHDWAATPVAVVERNGREHGEAAMRDLLAHLPADGSPVVLAMSDELALGARDAFAAAGRTAALAGWDGSPAALAAGVVTVAQPLREQGRLCARAALRPSAPVPAVRWEVSDPLAG